MNQRIKRTCTAFFTVLAVYIAYALVAVPLIEPSVAFAPSAESVPVARENRSFEHLFEPGSWELDRPKILETEQGTLLFDDYQPLPDRRKMQLNRCTFIRYLESSRESDEQAVGADAQHPERPIVLRAPGGATLTFDQRLDITQGTFGKLVAGKLAGEVVIFSPPTSSDANDALRIVTKNVQVNERRIWTPFAVRFQYGPNDGQGRDLRIAWQQKTAMKKGPKTDKSSFGSLRSLELVHVDKLQIQLQDESLFDADSPDELATSAEAEATSSPADGAPLDVTCDGPLKIDFIKQFASLADHVRIQRHIVNGPSDSLLCELMEIHFGGEGPDEKPADGPQGEETLPDLQPQKIIAVGYPFVLRAASHGAEARGQRLEYDCLSRRIWMEDSEQVLLENEQYRVEAPALEYELGPKGRLGRLWAKGPGHMQGRVEDESRSFRVTWGDEVRLRPAEGHHVLSLNGIASITMEETGQLFANEMHVYLREMPRPERKDKYDVVPDRMRAAGDVRFDSDELAARIQEANVWFKQPPEAAERDRTARPGDSGSESPSKRPKRRGANDDPSSQEPRGKYDLVAQKLNAQVLLSKPARIQRLTIQGQIQLRELDPKKAPGLSMMGQAMEVIGANTPRAEAILIGEPAQVAAQGMRLVGPNLKVRRTANALEVTGPGSMQLPGRTTDKGPLPPVEIQWQQGMHFDGKVAHFQRQVSLRGGQLLSNGDIAQIFGQGDSLRVALVERIDFKEPRMDDSNEVREIEFDAGAYLENHVFGPDGSKRMVHRLASPNLKVNQLSGMVNAQGPGWVSCLNRGGELAARALPDRPPAESQRNADGLDFLRVDFSRELRGNLHQGQIEFTDRVKTLYGPVADWNQSLDEKHPESWPDEAIMMTCQRLSIVDMSPKIGSFQQPELEATGNALVRGKLFSASGQRISYVRAKDQLVLEGDGRSDALLEYQPQPGAVPAQLKGRKILYWPKSNQFELNDVRALDLHDLNRFREKFGSP
jgi:hypothetical protein